MKVHGKITYNETEYTASITITEKYISFHTICYGEKQLKKLPLSSSEVRIHKGIANDGTPTITYYFDIKAKREYSLYRRGMEYEELSIHTYRGSNTLHISAKIVEPRYKGSRDKFMNYYNEGITVEGTSPWYFI